MTTFKVHISVEHFSSQKNLHNNTFFFAKQKHHSLAKVQMHLRYDLHHVLISELDGAEIEL